MKKIDEKFKAQYGNWIVLGFHKIDKHGDARWWCRCELCQKIYSVRGFVLRNGKSTGCKPCMVRRRRRD